MRRKVSLGRDYKFVETVDNAKYDGIERAVVIAHDAHLRILLDIFGRTMGYRVNTQYIDHDEKTLETKYTELQTKYTELQMNYAINNKVYELRTPPLVPMIELAWTKLAQAI